MCHTEQSHRHYFPSGSEMAAPHLYGSSPLLPTSGTVDIHGFGCLSRKHLPTTDADGKISFQTDCRLRPVFVSDKVFPGRDRGNDRSEEQRNLGYFFVSPAVKISFGVVVPIISAEDCSVYHTEQSGWFASSKWQ